MFNTCQRFIFWISDIEQAKQFVDIVMKKLNLYKI